MKNSAWLIVITFSFSLVLLFLLLFFKVRKQTMGRKTSFLSSRPAAVAGAFYPADPSVLENKIKQFLSAAKKIDQLEKPRILIVPHAGIEYSGQVAAWGFRQIEKEDYQKIILLGSSHTSWFDHAAIYSQGNWQTPLGEVGIDWQLAQGIIDPKKNILPDEEKHLAEHSLELELIFLQVVLSRFKIVPILVSDPDDQLIEDLAVKISQNFDDQTLLVVSSDLSHYPDYKTSQKVDQEIIEAILTGNKKIFETKFSQIEKQGYPNLETPACGYQAIRIALRVGEILGVNNYQQLFYANSGDVVEDKSRVVGYAAITANKESLDKQIEYLDPQAKKEALKIARQTLREYLTKKNIPKIEFQNEVLSKNLGVFVTLRKDHQLRGCIGELEPKKSLGELIQQMAVAAGSKDPRFPPVTIEELEEIKIEISVLTPLKKISDWRQIRLGKDGVVIKQGNRSGVFLPQVAQETGLSQEEFLSQLCWQKAGLSPDCYQDPKTEIYVFQAEVFEEEEVTLSE